MRGGGNTVKGTVYTQFFLLTGRGGVDTKFWLGVGILTNGGGWLTLNCGGGVGVGILSKRVYTQFFCLQVEGG